MEGAIRKDFLRELDEVRDELKDLSEESNSNPVPQKQPAFLPHIMTNMPFLSITLLFLLMFFLLIQMSADLYKLIALFFLIIASLSGVQQVEQIIQNKKRSIFEVLVGFVLIFTLAISYYVVWTFIAKYFWPIMIFLGIILLLGTFFFLLHAYIGYLKRIATYETGITALIMFSTWIAFLATLLEKSILYFLLFVVLLVLFGKASIDFSQRFRKRKIKREEM